MNALAPDRNPPRWSSAARAVLSPAGLSALVAVACYAVTLGGTFVYDDRTVVVDDPRVHAPGQWWRLFADYFMPPAVDRLYRPLTSLSYAVQWWVHGDWAAGYHAVNVALHAGVCGLVAVVAVRLAGSAVAGYVAGLLFAVHPVHAEVVASIAFRTESLCALFSLAALAVVLRPDLTRARAALAVGLAAAALLSKEQAVLLPPLLLLARWVRGQSVGGRGAGAERLLLAGCAWVPALYVLLREYFLRFRWERVLLEPGINVVIDAGPGVGRVLLPLALLGRYTWLLLWPARLSLDYGGTTVPTTVAWDDGFLWLGAATATLFVVASVVALRSGWRAVTFCLAGLAATYALPSNTFVLIGTHLAERLLYQPSAFLFLLIGLAVAAAWDARPAAHRRAMAGAFAVLLLALAARAWTYAAEWSDERAFLARSVERQPTSVKLHVALIDYHIRHAQADDAERVAVRLVDRLPQFFQSWGWAAQAAALSGDAEATQHRLTQAMRVAGRRYYGQVADHAFVARDLLASTRARHPATAAPVEAPSPTTGPR